MGNRNFLLFCSMQKKASRLLEKVILHSAFWVLVWFFFRSFFSVGTANSEFLFWYATFLTAISLITSYIFTNDLIPKYLFEKNYKKFAIYILYSGVFVTTAVLMLMTLGFVFFFNLEYKQMPVLIKNPYVVLVCVVLIIALTSAFKILKQNYIALDEKKTLENKFLQTKLELKEQELRFLKMQIHPHFLFNSLNTIYGFAIDKADEAPEMILKLSNLLDYILYQIEKPKVFLKEEIHHLEDYIDLEKMRFHDTLRVNFKKEQIDESIQIAPMLLIPFIENSFKHGVQIDGFLRVNIQLKIEKSFLFFDVENSFQKNADAKIGIGLSNIKKRLEMLYPQKYELEVLEENHTFKSLLKIEL